MAAIEDAGLQPKIMDLDFFALQNAYEANYPQSPHEAVALVDLGASSTKVVVIHSGVPVLTKESATGGNNLTAEIQRHLNLSFADAEALKTSSHAEAMPQEVNDLMQLASENIAQEIKRSIDFYSASSASAPISSILLAGGGSKIPGLSRIVEEKTGLPTQILNPFNSISYDPAVFTQDYVTAIAPLASIAVGLALRAGAP